MAARLLTLVNVPAGSTRFSMSDGISGAPPLGVADRATQVIVERRWHVPMTLSQLQAFASARPPLHLITYGTSTQGGPGERSTGVGYNDLAGSQVLGQLQLGFASRGGPTSDMWADAIVSWTNSAPVTANRDDASGPRFRVSMRSGCPASDAGIVGVRNSGSDLARALLPTARPTAALECVYQGANPPGAPFTLTRRVLVATAGAVSLASTVDQASLVPFRGAINCPADLGTVTVDVFSYPGRPDVDIWNNTSGCSSYANGVIASSFG